MSSFGGARVFFTFYLICMYSVMILIKMKQVLHTAHIHSYVFIIFIYFRMAGQYDTNTNLFCQEPQKVSRIFNHVQPFQDNVWFGLFVSFWAVFSAMFIIDNLQQKSNHRCLFTLFGAMFSQIR